MTRMGACEMLQDLTVTCLFIICTVGVPQASSGPFVDGKVPAALSTSGVKWSTEPAFGGAQFRKPTCLAAPPAYQDLVFVAEQGGEIYIVNKRDPSEGAKRLVLQLEWNQEWLDSGLLSFAFHPEFGTSDGDKNFLFVFYQYSRGPVDPLNIGPIHPTTFNRLSRFRIDTKRWEIVRDSEVVLIDQPDRSLEHNGGGLAFGRDGFLYLGVGDEGHGFEWENGRVRSRNLFSGVVRIDVDCDAKRSHPIRRSPTSSPAAVANYFIPNDNPFLDSDGGILEEFFVTGLRNPHRLSVDPDSGGIYIGEVGDWSGGRESIIRLEKGRDYGWPNSDSFSIAQERLEEKRFSYGREAGDRCVIGGYLYRGRAFPELAGKFIFGDNTSGRIWALRVLENGAFGDCELLLTLPSDMREYSGLSSFGIDAQGELYMCILGNPRSPGHVRKLVRNITLQQTNIIESLSSSGLFSDLETMMPVDGFVEYSVNHGFWSAGAEKRRFLNVPLGSDFQVGFSPIGSWSFPTGTVFVKHFDLPLDGAQKFSRIETRLLVLNGAHTYGLTYRWDESQKDAFLVSKEMIEDLTVRVASAEKWRQKVVKLNSIPSNNTPHGVELDSLFREFPHDFDLRLELNGADESSPRGILLERGKRRLWLVSLPRAEGGLIREILLIRDSIDHAEANVLHSISFLPNKDRNYPKWIRLQRREQLLRAFLGQDGIRWNSFGPEIKLPEGVVFCGSVESLEREAKAAGPPPDIVSTVRWHYPSPEQCLSCHNSRAGYVLGVNARQLNRDIELPGGQGAANQLQYLDTSGIFGNSKTTFDATTLSSIQRLSPLNLKGDIQAQVYSYLDANCRHCHMGDSINGSPDFRYESLIQGNPLVTNIVRSLLKHGSESLVQPNDVWRSVLYSRIRALGATGMPPIGKTTIDFRALNIVSNWICSLPGEPAVAPPVIHLIRSNGIAYVRTDCQASNVVALALKETGEELKVSLEEPMRIEQSMKIIAWRRGQNDKTSAPVYLAVDPALTSRENLTNADNGVKVEIYYSAKAFEASRPDKIKIATRISGDLIQDREKKLYAARLLCWLRVPDTDYYDFVFQSSCKGRLFLGEKLFADHLSVGSLENAVLLEMDRYYPLQMEIFPEHSDDSFSLSCSSFGAPLKPLPELWIFRSHPVKGEAYKFWIVLGVFAAVSVMMGCLKMRKCERR